MRELLAGLGIELTDAGERQLLAVQQTPVRAQVNLARGLYDSDGIRILGLL